MATVAPAVAALADRHGAERVLSLATDLSVPGAELQAVARFPEIDSLVNNMGTYALSDFFSTTDEDCLNFDFRRTLDAWPFLVDGKLVHMAVEGALQTNNGATMRQLTLAGLGGSRLGMFHVFDDIERGDLVELLPHYNAGDIEEINIIFLNHKHVPPRIRAFIEFVVERLSPVLAVKGDVGRLR